MRNVGATVWLFEDVEPLYRRDGELEAAQRMRDYAVQSEQLLARVKDRCHFGGGMTDAQALRRDCLEFDGTIKVVVTRIMQRYPDAVQRWATVEGPSWPRRVVSTGSGTGVDGRQSRDQQRTSPDDELDEWFDRADDLVRQTLRRLAGIGTEDLYQRLRAALSSPGLVQPHVSLVARCRAVELSGSDDRNGQANVATGYLIGRCALGTDRVVRPVVGDIDDLAATLLTHADFFAGDELQPSSAWEVLDALSRQRSRVYTSLEPTAAVALVRRQMSEGIRLALSDALLYVG